MASFTSNILKEIMSVSVTIVLQLKIFMVLKLLFIFIKLKKKTKSYCTNILTEIGILLAVHRSGSGPPELPVGQPLEAPLEVEQQPNNRQCSEPTHSRNRMQRRISFCME